MNATQSALALTCEREHTAPRMQKEKKMEGGGIITLPSTHMCAASPTHMTLEVFSNAPCQSVCIEWALPGKARATAELVCWCWVSMWQRDLATAQANREGAMCYMLH